jgi:tRNA (cytidine/uridine-2'-O-)-methyltransferase
MAACFGVACEIIGPAGFDLSDRALRRAGLDYLDKVTLIRHLSFKAFEISRRASGHRLVVLTTSAAKAHTAFDYRAGDVLLLGRESAGVPQNVHGAADARLRIPMQPGLRSLNVAVAAAIVLGEALRQTGGFELLQEDTAGSTS